MLDAYRTFCIAPPAEIRTLFESVRAAVGQGPVVYVADGKVIRV